MPKSLVRPSKSEIQAIQSALIKSSDAALPPTARRRLRMVLAWADGQSFRNVAKDVGCGRDAVQTAVSLYRSQGLAGFVGRTAKAPGRPPLADSVKASIASALRMHADEGVSPPYRRIAAEHGVSAATVAKIAKARNLDAASRRGRVAQSLSQGSGARAP